MKSNWARHKQYGLILKKTHVKMGLRCPQKKGTKIRFLTCPGEAKVFTGSNPRTNRAHNPPLIAIISQRGLDI